MTSSNIAQVILLQYLPFSTITSSHSRRHRIWNKRRSGSLCQQIDGYPSPRIEPRFQSIRHRLRGVLFAATLTFNLKISYIAYSVRWGHCGEKRIVGQHTSRSLVGSLSRILSVCVCVYIYIYIYIYREREREREREEGGGREEGREDNFYSHKHLYIYRFVYMLQLICIIR